MSIRCDTSSLIAGSIVCGVPGLGILGSVILATTGDGGSGPGILFNDVELGDENKEFRGLVTDFPDTGTFVINENGTFTFTGPSADSFQYQLYVDGVAIGSPATVALYGDSTANYSLTCETGAYTLTGVDADLIYTSNGPTAYTLTCETGSYSLEGVDAQLLVNGVGEVAGRGFVFTDSAPVLWWKRKPKAVTQEVAEKKVKRVAKVIKEIAGKQVDQAQTAQQAKREVAQAIAPMLAEMPGFDWTPLYRTILDGFERKKREEAARTEAAAQIARIRAIEQDDEDVLILLMSL